MQNHPHVDFEHRVRIGGNHGYRMNGDMVSLNAELLVAHDEAIGTGWALQLWACDHPYEGGVLQGFKVAEIPVTLPSRTAGSIVRLEAETVAHLPSARREFAMILVLAAGERETFNQVRDFATYPNRHLFEIPFLEGTVGYSFQRDSVVLRVDGVHNPRPCESSSGSMVLELWALATPFSSGALDGVLLARAEVGEVTGQRSVGPLEYSVPLSWPPTGRWWIALLLREWTTAGFLTRDSRNFSVPFDNASASPEMPTASLVTRRDETYSKPELLGPPAAPPFSPSHDEIALAAYHRYLARGRAPGLDVHDWLEAERDLLGAPAASPRAG
jgi:hypothetical protein